jgi:hypothetical protein
MPIDHSDDRSQPNPTVLARAIVAECRRANAILQGIRQGRLAQAQAVGQMEQCSAKLHRSLRAYHARTDIPSKDVVLGHAIALELATNLPRKSLVNGEGEPESKDAIAPTHDREGCIAAAVRFATAKLSPWAAAPKKEMKVYTVLAELAAQMCTISEQPVSGRLASILIAKAVSDSPHATTPWNAGLRLHYGSWLIRTQRYSKGFDQLTRALTYFENSATPVPIDAWERVIDVVDALVKEGTIGISKPILERAIKALTLRLPNHEVWRDCEREGDEEAQEALTNTRLLLLHVHSSMRSWPEVQRLSDQLLSGENSVEVVDEIVAIRSDALFARGEKEAAIKLAATRHPDTERLGVRIRAVLFHVDEIDRWASMAADKLQKIIGTSNPGTEASTAVQQSVLLFFEEVRRNAPDFVRDLLPARNTKTTITDLHNFVGKCISSALRLAYHDFHEYEPQLHQTPLNSVCYALAVRIFSIAKRFGCADHRPLQDITKFLNQMVWDSQGLTTVSKGNLRQFLNHLPRGFFAENQRHAEATPTTVIDEISHSESIKSSTLRRVLNATDRAAQREDRLLELGIEVASSRLAQMHQSPIESVRILLERALSYALLGERDEWQRIIKVDLPQRATLFGASEDTYVQTTISFIRCIGDRLAGAHDEGVKSAQTAIRALVKSKEPVTGIQEVAFISALRALRNCGLQEKGPLVVTLVAYANAVQLHENPTVSLAARREVVTFLLESAIANLQVHRPLHPQLAVYLERFDRNTLDLESRLQLFLIRAEQTKGTDIAAAMSYYETGLVEYEDNQSWSGISVAAAQLMYHYGEIWWGIYKAYDTVAESAAVDGKRPLRRILTDVQETRKESREDVEASPLGILIDAFRNSPDGVDNRRIAAACLLEAVHFFERAYYLCRSMYEFNFVWRARVLERLIEGSRIIGGTNAEALVIQYEQELQFVRP